MQPFTPGTTVNIDVSSSAQATALTGAKGGVTQVRAFNDGTATAWIMFGNSNVASSLTTSTGMPVGPNQFTEVLTLPNTGGAPYASAIAAGATGKIYFTIGEGN